MSSEQYATIQSYIKKYAEKHHITFKEAKRHAMCELAALYFKENK